MYTPLSRHQAMKAIFASESSGQYSVPQWYTQTSQKTGFDTPEVNLGENEHKKALDITRFQIIVSIHCKLWIILNVYIKVLGIGDSIEYKVHCIYTIKEGNMPYSLKKENV